MKKTLGLLALLALSTLPAFGQSEGYPRFEAGGGMLYRSYNNQFTDRQTEVGWFANTAFNFSNYVGLDLNVDEGFHGPDAATFEYRHWTFMAGPQIYPLGHRHVTPFVHFLVGDSTLIYPGLKSEDSNETFSDDKLSFEFGGGADWSLTRHIAIRLADIDYEQNYNLGGGSNGNPVQHNFKYEGGVMFRF